MATNSGCQPISASSFINRAFHLFAPSPSSGVHALYKIHSGVSSFAVSLTTAATPGEPERRGDTKQGTLARPQSTQMAVMDTQNTQPAPKTKRYKVGRAVLWVIPLIPGITTDPLNIKAELRGATLPPQAVPPGPAPPSLRHTTTNITVRDALSRQDYNDL